MCHSSHQDGVCLAARKWVQEVKTGIQAQFQMSACILCSMWLFRGEEASLRVQGDISPDWNLEGPIGIFLLEKKYADAA
jgi:hypothetical protein